MSFALPPILNLEKLRNRCFANIGDFAKDAKLQETPHGRYFFQDNGAKILAVAHLDTVQQRKHFHYFNLVDKDTVFCPLLDDRLGAYVILDVLPKLGCKYDILLTENEECCQSTAKWFLPPSFDRYNWMFEFDRAGTDVAMYQYLTNKLDNLFFEKYGVCAAHGSYTDIVDLDFLEVRGFNFGCGYHDHHSLLAHFKISELMDMLRVFLEFYNDFKNTRFKYSKKKQKKQERRSWGNIRYEDFSEECANMERMRFENSWIKYIDEPRF